MRFLLKILLTALFAGSILTANQDNLIKIGSSIVPHADILRFIKPKLKEKGYELRIFEFNDGVIPNVMVEEGELDANYFQHLPYLKEFNESRGTHIVSVGSIHIEPMGIYSSKHKKFDPKDQATISIPNNPTNEARALRIIASAGLITLKDSELVTPRDILDNPKNLRFIELKDAHQTRALSDVDFAVINSNMAILGGLNPVKDSLYTESKFSEYGNIIAVKEGNENLPKIKALLEVLKSPEVKAFIEEKFKGALIPTF